MGRMKLLKRRRNLLKRRRKLLKRRRRKLLTRRRKLLTRRRKLLKRRITRRKWMRILSMRKVYPILLRWVAHSADQD